MSGCGGANGRRVSRGRFRVVGCGAFRLDFDGGLGGETQESALFLPVMRQVFAQLQQLGRRQLDGMSACDEPWADFSLGAILIRSTKAFFNSSNNLFLPKTSLPSADAAAIAMAWSQPGRGRV